MAKELHVLNFVYKVTQNNDPTSLEVNDQIDLALALSKKLGRNIRQGHAFKVRGIGAHLSPQGASDADTGMSATVGLIYAPVTKHSVSAWRQMFTKWQKQKQLSGKVGRYVRYDDFECAIRAGLNTARTSTVLAGGLGDTNPEHITIYDAASSGTRTSLQDMYNSYNPIPEESTDEFGVSIKSPKFTEFFPEPAALFCSATNSAMASWARWDEVNPTPGVADYLASSENVHYMGADASTEYHMFPGNSYVNVLCGLFNVTAHLMPPDVDTGDIPPGAETNWDLNVTILVEGWTPLAEGSRKKGGSSGRRRR